MALSKRRESGIIGRVDRKEQLLKDAFLIDVVERKVGRNSMESKVFTK